MTFSKMDFLTQAVSALTIIAAVVLSFVAYVFAVKRADFKKWKKSYAKGSVSSAALGIVSILVIALILYIASGPAKAENLSNGTWFNDTSVFLGIDVTKGTSPQCVKGSTDEYGTSNLGINQNLWRSEKSIFDVNARYTHHSCVLGKDRNGYDGVGIMLVWYLNR